MKTNVCETCNGVWGNTLMFSCPFCRIVMLEAENARLVNYLAARIFNVDIDEFGEALVQQVREFVNSEKYQQVFGKKQGGER